MGIFDTVQYDVQTGANVDRYTDDEGVRSTAAQLEPHEAEALNAFLTIGSLFATSDAQCKRIMNQLAGMEDFLSGKNTPGMGLLKWREDAQIEADDDTKSDWTRERAENRVSEINDELADLEVMGKVAKLAYRLLIGEDWRPAAKKKATRTKTLAERMAERQAAADLEAKARANTAKRGTARK